MPLFHSRTFPPSLHSYLKSLGCYLHFDFRTNEVYKSNEIKPAWPQFLQHRLYSIQSLNYLECRNFDLFGTIILKTYHWSMTIFHYLSSVFTTECLSCHIVVPCNILLQVIVPYNLVKVRKSKPSYFLYFAITRPSTWPAITW